MNNKKLFKGALVLFASILMAVSCSSNSNPNDNNDSNSNNNNNNNTTTKTDIEVDLDATTGVLKTLSTANKVFQVKNSETALGTAKEVVLVLTGKDKDKVNSIAIKSIKGLAEAKANEATALSSLITTKEDFSTGITFTTSMISPSKKSDNCTLTAQPALVTETKKVSKANADKKGGLIEVVVTLNPTDTTKYNTKDITIYIGIVGEA